MAYLTVLNNRTTTPAAILAQWMQYEAEQASLKAQHINVDIDPYEAQQRIAAAYRNEQEPPADAVALRDYRGMFISAVLDAIQEHIDASRGGHGDPAKHTACVQAWRLAAKAAQVNLKLGEIARFVGIAERRSTELVQAARQARKHQRRAA